jgi:threonine/homoserine/homoserine lactone efflux protein|tara:strand:+ start:2389 stop:2982 length:594 start_codon:yes stop_codon:yes gene_type:complete
VNIPLLIAALVFLIPMYITPGPNNILCAVHGSQHGFRATIPLISGFVIGWFVMGLFVALTIDFLEQNTGLLTYLTMIGASYMIYLSYKIATSKPLDDGPNESQRLTPLTGAMLQFVNGKAWIHDIVLLGSFGTIFGTGILAKMTLIIFSIILCLPFVALWAGFGTFLRNFFTSPESSLMLNRVMGFSLFIVAVWLLV